jgi:hypothetical protein
VQAEAAHAQAQAEAALNAQHSCARESASAAGVAAAQVGALQEQVGRYFLTSCS